LLGSVVSGSESESLPTTTTTNTTHDQSKKTTMVKASELAKNVIVKPADYSDPYVASDRGKAVRAAREADHIFAVGETCICCRIKLTTIDRRFCRDCDETCDGTCQMQDVFLALHRDFGGDWRDSVFAPFNEKRLVEIAGRVVTRAVRVALNSTPKNAKSNLDRVLQLVQYRIEAMSRLRPTAGVVAALEDLYTMVLWITRHCESVGQGVIQ
jgi:hypothetical protein